MIDKFFKYYILKNVDDIWYLFGIDLLRKKCYVIQVNKNYNSKTSISTLNKGRSYWAKLRTKGYQNIVLKNELNIPSLLTQRLKEWNSFCFNQYNGWKNKRRITDPWINQPIEVDEKNIKNSYTNENEVNIYTDSQRNNFEGIEEFGDFDNFWNQEGVFEDLSDKDEFSNNKETSVSNPFEEFNGLVDDDLNEENRLKEIVINFVDNAEYYEVIKICNQILKMNPDCSFSWYHKGFSNLKLKRYDDAISDFNNSLKNDPNNPEVFNFKGLAKVCLGDWVGSINDFNKALNISPKYAIGYEFRGQSKYFLGKYEDAIKDLNLALKINNKNAYALQYLGRCKVQLGDIKGAIKDFTEAIKITPQDCCSFYQRGIAKFRINNFKDGIDDFTKALEIEPKYADAFCYRGICKSKLNNHQNAIEDYLKALEIDQQNVITFYNMGVSKFSLKDYKSAIEDYTKALEIEPKYLDALCNRGVCKGLLNDHENAIKDYSKVLELDPRNILAWKNKGGARFDLKDYKSAIEDYTKALEIEPKYLEALYFRGLAKYNLRDDEGAIVDFSKALEIDPEREDALYSRGLAKHNLKDYQGAINDYTRVLKINPIDSVNLYNRGVSKYHLKDYQGAIEDYTKALEINPEYFRGWSNRGAAKYDLKDYEGAIKDYTKALEINPGYFLGWSNRGIARSYIKDYQGAIEDYTKALEINPKDLVTLTNRGKLYLFLKKEKLANIDFDKISEIDPEFSVTKNRLVSSKIEQEENKNNNFQEIKNTEKEGDGVESLLKELDSFIGLEKIKFEIKSLINFQQIQRERDSYGYINQSLNNHMVFYGPPGTGKTEIARLVGKIFKNLGILSKGHFVEADRSNLIGGYIGQTAIKTQDVLKSALGGVLFIDEAYSLNASSISGDFGAEAISTILKFMEDNRDDFILIVAGYEVEMREFLNLNTGLKSRFSTQLMFPNFSEKELLQILLKIASDKGYKIQENSKTLLKNNLAKISEFKKPTFGNARSMRNLLEIAIKNQAIRLIKNKERTRTDLEELILDDFEITSKQLEDI